MKILTRMWRILRLCDPRTSTKTYTVSITGWSGGSFPSYWRLSDAERAYYDAVRSHAAPFISLHDHVQGRTVRRADLSEGRRPIIQVETGQIVGMTRGSHGE